MRRVGRAREQMAERTEEEMPAAGGIIRGSSNRLRGSSKVLAQSLSNARTTARWRISSTHRLRTVITGGTTGARTRMDTLASILTTNTRTLLTRCTTRERCQFVPAKTTSRSRVGCDNQSGKCRC